MSSPEVIAPACARGRPQAGLREVPVSLGKRLLAGAIVLLALALTFAMYFDPDLVVELSQRVWSCF